MTGAAGFLGREALRQLRGHGAEVHATTRGRSPVAGASTLQAETPAELAQCVRRIAPDLVLHLASPVSLAREPEVLDALWPGIFETTDAVARACLALDTRLIVAGSCEEYGDGPAPFREAQAASPISPYGTAKAAATHRVQALARANGLRATVVRPFLTYGPGQDPERLVPAALDAATRGQAFATTDGRQTREFNHVSDIVRGVLAARRPAATGRVINIGGGPELTVLEMVRRIWALAGADPALIQVGALPRRAGESDRFVGDHSLAGSLLGHRPLLSLDQGLAATLAAWRQRVED